MSIGGDLTQSIRYQYLVYLGPDISHSTRNIIKIRGVNRQGTPTHAKDLRVSLLKQNGQASHPVANLV